MKLFYCPKCHKEKITNDDVYKNEYTIANMRGGYGRPIRHYKCECGNYLAGSMDISDWENDKYMIEFCKETIEDYNKNGDYYNAYLRDGIDLFEKAQQVYKEKSNWTKKHSTENKKLS